MTRGNTLWVWQAHEPAIGWSQIVAYIPFAAVTGPLAARARHIADAMRDVAIAHGQAMGQVIRLAEFTISEEIERINPKEAE